MFVKINMRIIIFLEQKNGKKEETVMHRIFFLVEGAAVYRSGSLGSILHFSEFVV